MPLQATSGAASYDGFGGGVAAVPNYIEECFSTTLYTGNGSTQTITNGIDLAGEGGLVWIKNRTGAISHALIDTARGGSQVLSSDTTSAQANYSPQGISAFDSSGFTVNGAATTINSSSYTYASWTFRKQPKFFDVVTWTGNGVAGRQISHSLGSVPACIIVKGMETTNNWPVYHQSLGNTKHLNLNTTDSQLTSDTWNNTSPTATEFTIGSLNSVNQNGYQFVAYLFAHNAGGFGLTGTDNVISCGSFTTDASANASVTLGYEPQWVLIKRTDSAGYWDMLDNMRGMTVGTSNAFLWANTSDAEMVGQRAQPFATGFNYNGSNSASYIYIAIRRGPMKVPTSGTSVFAPAYYASGLATGTKSVTNFPVDMQIARYPDFGSSNSWVADRLRGVSSNATASGPYLMTFSTNAETTNSSLGWDNTGFLRSPNLGTFDPQVYWNFRRAPSFFDEVCYTGTGVAGRNINHNLGVAPELMIIKRRDAAGYLWRVYSGSLGPTQALELNTNVATVTDLYWNDTAPTASVFTVYSYGQVNASGGTYVAYLFATCAGVSKVGSYTGTGTTKQVDCGFTGGARFVLIKRTDSTGDWYVWDSARGIVSGNDPYLLLNSTAAETTSTDYIDTYSAGFEISSTAPATINASGGTFIFLAIA